MMKHGTERSTNMADPPHWSTEPAVPLDAAPVDSDVLVQRLREYAEQWHTPDDDVELVTIAAAHIEQVTRERDAALAVVRAVYRESKAIHAAYKALPEELRLRVERPSPMRYEKHGGIGFSSTCDGCQVSGTGSEREGA